MDMCPPQNPQVNPFMPSAPPPPPFQFQSPQNAQFVPSAPPPPSAPLQPSGQPQFQRPLHQVSFSQSQFFTQIPAGAYAQQPMQMAPPPPQQQPFVPPVFPQQPQPQSPHNYQQQQQQQQQAPPPPAFTSPPSCQDGIQMVNLSKVNLDSSSSDDDGYSSSRSNSVSEKKVNKKISISSSSDDDDDDSSDNDSTDSSASKKKKKKVSFSSSDSSSDSDSAIYGGGDPHIHHPVAGGHKVSSSCVAPSMAAGLGSVPMFARPAPRGRGRGAGRNIHGQQSQQQKQGQGTPRKSNTKGVGLGNINNNGLLQTLTTTQGCIGQALGNTFTPDVMASKHSGNKKGGKNAGAVKKPQQQQQQQQQQQLLQQKQKPITKDSLNTMIMHEEEENADKKRKKNKNKVIPFRPLFVISITLVEIIVYVIELLKTKSVSNITWGSNPWQWGGIDSNVVIDFGGKYAPYTLRRSEWWRVFTPTFLHVSLPHIVLVLLLQLKVGWSLEKSFGGWRIAAIYVLSAISGNLLSSILMYSQIAAGASGSLFGFLALLFVDLFKAWKRIAKPIPNLIALIFTTVFALFLGFMPGVDNFMHIGGFIAGILAGVVFLPSPLASPKKRKMTIIVVAPILVIYFVILFVLLFAVLGSQEIPEDWCKSCTSINCAEALLGESWCRN